MVATREDATLRLQGANAFNNFVGTGAVAGLEWGRWQFALGPNVVLNDGFGHFEVEISQNTLYGAGDTTVYVD